MGRLPTNSKEKLIQTANDLIWKSSYGSVSVDDICNVSNVKKGSFYYYFSSKAELAVVVIETSYQHFEAELIKVFATSTLAIDRFNNLATFVYDKQKEACDKYGHVCGCPFASLGSEMVGNNEIIRKKIEDIFHQQRNLFLLTLNEMVAIGQLPKNTNQSAMANQIHTFMMGQVMMSRIQNDLTHLKKEMEAGFLRILGLDK